MAHTPKEQRPENVGWPKRLTLTSDLSDYPQPLIENADFVVSYSGAVIKDRNGSCGQPATAAECRTCKTVDADEASLLVDEAAWRGQPPAEGTRRATILEAVKRGDVLSDTEALEIADAVELALRRGYGTEDDLLNAVSVADRMQEEMEAAIDVLDQLSIPHEEGGKVLDLGARITVLGNRLDALSDLQGKQARRDRLMDVLAKHEARLYDGHGGKLASANRVDLANEIERALNPHLPADYKRRIDTAEPILPRPFDQSSHMARQLSTIAELEDRVRSLTSQREGARIGEDGFKAQRDAALHLLRWLIGDIIPGDLIELTAGDDRG